MTMTMTFNEMLGIQDQSLDEIAQSLLEVPDKASDGHNYVAYYDRHFAPLRDKPLRLLEIGVWHGYSLAMWSQYFSHASIVGADIDIALCQVVPDRCRLWEMNQGNKESLVNMALHLGPWDIIIDDGSHDPRHQVLTFETLWPYLNAGGLYCVEDLHPNYTHYASERPRMVDFIGTVLQADLHGRGKTSLATAANSSLKEQQTLEGRELEIEAIHLYRYLCIISKR